MILNQVDISYDQLCQYNFALWLYLVNLFVFDADENKLSDVISSILGHHPELVEVVDQLDNTVWALLVPNINKVISILILFGINNGHHFEIFTNLTFTL